MKYQHPVLSSLTQSFALHKNEILLVHNFSMHRTQDVDDKLKLMRQEKIKLEKDIRDRQNRLDEVINACMLH